MAIVLSRHEEFALITLDRPDALNALSFGLLRDLGRALDEVGGSDARALLITGAAGKAFCAGADIGELTARSLVAQKQGAEMGQAVMARLDRLTMPSVAIVNGYAFGGGLELALACTFRLATPNARMGLPEIKLGLFPGGGGSQRLMRQIPLSQAKMMMYTGDPIDAARAQALGLVNDVVPRAGLRDAAMALAQRLAANSAQALKLLKHAMLHGREMPLDAALAYERSVVGVLFDHPDVKEGCGAFVEKRPARFHTAGGPESR